MNNSNSNTAIEIKRRVLLWSGVSLLMLLGVVIGSNYYYERQNLHAEVLSRIDKIETTFVSNLNQDTEVISGLLPFIQNDKSLQKAFLTRDRKTLYDIAYPIFEHIRQKYRVTHFYFHDTDAVNFLRVHNYDRHGDAIKRFTMMQSKSTGKESSGIELGTFGTFTLRVVQPWVIDQKIVGYIELGEEIEHLTPKLKLIYGSDLVFAIHKAFLTRAQWEHGLKMLERQGDWDLIEDFVVIDSTLNHLTPNLLQTFNSMNKMNYDEASSKLQTVHLTDRTYMGLPFALSDAAKGNVGIVLALHDVTLRQKSLQTSLMIIGSCFVAVGVMVLVLSKFWLEKMETEIVESQTRLEHEIHQHEVTEQSLREANRLKEQINEELQRSMAKANNLAQEAETASLAKSQFLANMSHELRTPMNAVIGYSEMLIEDAQDLGLPKASADLKKISSAGKHLLTLINDILDISKIEAGKMELHFEPCELKSLLYSIEEMLRPHATEKGIDLTIHINSIPRQIVTDEMRLRQCLLNLINNAIKFTSAGYVRIHVSEQQINHSSMICFDVKDNGIGIAADKQELIFEAFSQADSGTTRKFGGTGLGLAITKRLAQQLGGDLIVQSEVGQGSTFTFTVPVTLDDADNQSFRHLSESDCVALQTPPMG